jgi:Domain of unknown function (DUF4249)
MLKNILFFFCILLFVSCSKDYNIKLPSNKSELVVECYVENGQPIRALISESTNLLDTSTTPPIFIQAIVIISHGNIKDTLRPFPFVDTLRKKVYNYGNTKNIVANYTNNEKYTIDVYDTKGRHAYGSTQFIEPVNGLSFTPIFNTQQKAYCLTKFSDNSPNADYYRLLLNKNTLYDSVDIDVLIDNSFANANNEFIYGSGYNFKMGDVINGRVFHLTYDYYLYLTTLQNARAALVNPFAVSGEVISNIKGGLGVFTALSYTSKSVTVP